MVDTAIVRFSSETKSKSNVCDTLDTSKNEIRVLKILPGLRLTPIQCKLARRSLDTKPEYRALSYTWGASHQKHTIWLRNEHQLRFKVAVTDNLYNALSNIRSNTVEKVYWIDALCIDQSDNVEKSSQIGIMGEIYRSAQRVEVWLGVDRNDSFADRLFRWVLVHQKWAPAQRIARNKGSFNIKASIEASIGEDFLQSQRNWHWRSTAISQTLVAG